MPSQTPIVALAFQIPSQSQGVGRIRLRLLLPRTGLHDRWVEVGRAAGSQDREMTSSCLGQFPPQTAASPDEQKVFALWESGDMSDQVRCCCCCFFFFWGGGGHLSF